MGKSKPKVEVTQYRMSIHFGICHGIPDYISEIKIAEKTAWAGQQAVQGSFIIDQPELFGGDKKEGGAVGEVHYFPGNDTQTVSDYLAGKLSLTSATMPAYRGVSSAWFTEYAGARENGFYWSANNPYLPTVWIKVARPSLLLNEHEARIWRLFIQNGAPGAEFPSETLDTFRGFDTNNDYAVIFHSVGGNNKIEVWNIVNNDLRSFNIDGTVAFESVWITNDNEIMVISGGNVLGTAEITLNFYDADTLVLKQTHSMGDLLNLGFWASEVPADNGDKYLFFVMPYAFAPWPYRVFKKEPGDQTWSLVMSAESDGTVTDNGRGATLGNDYAYVYKSGSVVRITYPTFTETLVTPTGLAGRSIKLFSYFPSTDEIVAVCSNNDIIVYSPDLVTLKREASFALNFADATVDNLNNRFQLGNYIVLPVNDGTGRVTEIALIDVDTLAVSQTIPIYPDSGYVLEDEPMFSAAVNQRYGGIFVGRPFEDSTYAAYWPLLPSGEYDSNPSHVIFEALQNVEWGMGAPESSIDRDSFEAAATVLYNEQLGISFIWTKQSTIETLIREVLDHIEAVLFVSPRTGLITLKLIRDDYTITGLPEFTPDNSVVTNFARKLWGETINEVVVTFTNPLNEETETVVAQDLANIEIQGGPISDSRNYYMLRVKEVAMKLAQRDLRKSSTPLASCDIEVNRTAWDLLPGDVCILNSPEDGINSIVMRVGPVDYGKPGDSKVRAQLIEDIFSLPTADYTIPPDTEWENPAEQPSPADETLIFTLPYFFAVNQIDATILDGTAHPEVFAGILAAEEGQDTSEFELYGSETDATGTVTQGQLGTKSIASYAELSEALEPEVTSSLPTFADRTQGHGPSVGGFMYIEGTDETDHELCLVTAVTSSAVTVNRGVLDTIPRSWPIGTPVWFVDGNMIFEDSEIRSEGETVSYKILIRTSLGLLAVAQAPTVAYTLTDRPWLPLRPADVAVNGDDGFAGLVDCIGVNPIPVTWARRNRETEDAVVLAWDAADVTPETGQTTTVTLTDVDGVVLHTYSGIAGTSQNVDPAHFGGESFGYIIVSAVRDGLDSLQGYSVLVQVDAGALFEFEDGEPYEFEDEALKEFEDAI